MKDKFTTAQEMNKLASLRIYEKMSLSERVACKSLKQYFLTLQMIEYHAFNGSRILFVEQYLFIETIQMLEDQGFTVVDYSEGDTFEYLISW